MSEGVVLKKCPYCGTDPNGDLDDAVYPVNRKKTKWCAGCPHPECGASD